mgnify:CR=1 FL=1
MLETRQMKVNYLFQKTENVITKLYRSRLFCMLHLGERETKRTLRTRMSAKQHNSDNDALN